MFVVFFSDSSNSSWDLILGYKHELIMRLLHHVLFEKKQTKQNKTKQTKTEQNIKEKKRVTGKSKNSHKTRIDTQKLRENKTI